MAESSPPLNPNVLRQVHGEALGHQDQFTCLHYQVVWYESQGGAGHYHTRGWWLHCKPLCPSYPCQHCTLTRGQWPQYHCQALCLELYLLCCTWSSSLISYIQRYFIIWCCCCSNNCYPGEWNRRRHIPEAGWQVWRWIRFVWFDSWEFH